MNIKRTLIFEYWKGLLNKYPEKFVKTYREVENVVAVSPSDYSKAVLELMSLVVDDALEDVKYKREDLLFLVKTGYSKHLAAHALTEMAILEEREKFLKAVKNPKGL